jgi:hypothetical protein
VPSKARVEKFELKAREAAEALDHLLSPSEIRGRGTCLQDLMTRAEISSKPDGYSRGAGGEKVGGGGTADSTQANAIARLEDVCSRCDDEKHSHPGLFVLDDGRKVTCRACGGSGRRWADPLSDAVDELLERLGVVSRLCKIIDRKRELVLGAASGARGRVSSLQGSCLVCEAEVSGSANDRLKRGMCNKDYLAWGVWRLSNPPSGDPGADFNRFKTQRLAHLKELAEKRERMATR